MVRSARLRDPATYVAHPFTSAEVSAIQRRYWARLSPDEKAKRLASFIAGGQRHNKRAARTEIEEIVAKELIKGGLPFQRNVQFGRYNVDFTIGDQLIVEWFGDFWHCSPHIYDPDDRNASLKMTAADKWGRDLARTRSLVQLGYHVLIFWESTIRRDADAVIARIASAANWWQHAKG